VEGEYEHISKKITSDIMSFVFAPTVWCANMFIFSRSQYLLLSVGYFSRACTRTAVYSRACICAHPPRGTCKHCRVYRIFL